MSILFLLLCMYGVLGYVQLLPQNPMVNSTLPSSSLRIYDAVDLIERTTISPPPGTTMRVQLATLHDTCRLTSIAIPPRALVLVDQQAARDAKCLSRAQLLQSMDQQGIDASVLVGFYEAGTGVYGKAHPFNDIDLYSSTQMPAAVQGIAVDPSFILAVQDRLAKDSGAVYAFVQREPGTYNDILYSSGFYALWVIVLLALVVSFAYGLVHFVWPPVLYVYHVKLRHNRQALPDGWISPGEARYWRPDVSTIIRLSSLYCLLAWIISWPYKRTLFKNVMYYTAIYAATVGFCFMVYRWCGIMQQVKGHWFYRVMRYWTLVEVIVATVAVYASCTYYYYTDSPSYTMFRLVSNSYIEQGSLITFSLSFCVLSFVSLRRMREIKMSARASNALRKITIIGIVGLVNLLIYFVLTIVDMTQVGDIAARYIVGLAIQSAAWISYHTLIVYMLSIPVPTMNVGHDESYPLEGDGDPLQSEEEINELLHTPVDPKVRWESIVLAKRTSTPQSPNVKWRSTVDYTLPAVVNVSESGSGEWDGSTPRDSTRQSFGLDNEFG